MSSNKDNRNKLKTYWMFKPIFPFQIFNNTDGSCDMDNRSVSASTCTACTHYCIHLKAYKFNLLHIFYSLKQNIVQNRRTEHS